MGAGCPPGVAVGGAGLGVDHTPWSETGGTASHVWALEAVPPVPWRPPCCKACTPPRVEAVEGHPTAYPPGGLVQLQLSPCHPTESVLGGS